MLSTILLIAVGVGLFLLTGVAWALTLRLGLWWAKAKEVTARRVIGATVLVISLNSVLYIAFIGVAMLSGDQALLLALVELALALIVPCIVISQVFRIRKLRAFQAWLPTLLAPLILLPLAYGVVRPFLFETFVQPTNSMAPTLLGRHWKGICPTCGAPNYCTARDDNPFWQRYEENAPPPPMICDNFHVTEPATIDRMPHNADRFIVAKFFQPQRWDLMVFQYPPNPETLYVKRVVGFPGETVHIADGAVWIDGVKQTLPASIAGIEYVSPFPENEFPGEEGLEMEWWGSEQLPANLGDDEYFVLGDFSKFSSDSRVWPRSNPARTSFAVPAANIQGVVTHTYWPPSRWRNHR